jgi:hypothetical protein
MHQHAEALRDFTSPVVVRPDAVGVGGLDGAEQVAAHQYPPSFGLPTRFIVQF